MYTKSEGKALPESLMRYPVRWEWTRQREIAARMVAEGSLTAIQIAKEIGVSRETIRFWKRSPQFQAQVNAYIEEARKALSKHLVQCTIAKVGMAKKAKR